MSERTLEDIEVQPGFSPRITLEELEGRTKFRTPGPWRVAPTSDYPPGENPGLNIDAGEFGLDGFVCEVCGPNPDEQMRADAYFIAHAPDLLAIAQKQRAREALIVEAAVAEIRQQRRFALEESGCGGPEINDSLDMAERRFRDAIADIGTKR